MTKADFLQLLERALAQLPEEERRANLEYYSELLDDMLEEGMTEAEATAKLGSPSQIAQSILQEVPLGKLVSTRMKPKSGWTPLATLHSRAQTLASSRQKIVVFIMMEILLCSKIPMERRASISSCQKCLSTLMIFLI